MATTHTTTTSGHAVRRITWGPWGVARWFVGILGTVFIALGVLALADTGVGTWVSPDTEVLGFGHTPLMAVFEITLGLTIVLAAPYPFSARGSLLGLGILMTVFGIVTIVDPGALADTLGVNRQMGVLYLSAGLGSAVTGSLVPVFR